jgi:hypothetical protein
VFHDPEDTVFFVIISRGYGGQGVFFDDGRGTLDFTGVPALRIRGLYKEKERVLRPLSQLFISFLSEDCGDYPLRGPRSSRVRYD